VVTLKGGGVPGRLATAPHGAMGGDGTALARVTRALLDLLNSLVTQIKALEAQIAGQLARRAEAHVFTLSRSWTVRAARLLAKIGDCRGRYPVPVSLIYAAGCSRGIPLHGRAAGVRRAGLMVA